MDEEGPVTDADVIIVGAGPTGLLLACELGLAGVRALVLERQPQIRDIPKAGGLGGQILELTQGFLSRAGASADSFQPASPNAQLGACFADGGVLDTFHTGAEWQSRWLASDAANWAASGGALRHAGSAAQWRLDSVQRHDGTA